MHTADFRCALSTGLGNTPEVLEFAWRVRDDGTVSRAVQFEAGQQSWLSKFGQWFKWKFFSPVA